MKRFTFTLDRVRQWREKQLALEDAKLEKLFSEKTLIEQSRELLERESQESAVAVSRSTAITASDLQALDRFRRYVAGQRSVFAAKVADCERRIAAQHGACTEARRKVELLDKLKEKKLKSWNEELAREIEAQAQEAYLAKWNSRQ